MFHYLLSRSVTHSLTHSFAMKLSLLARLGLGLGLCLSECRAAEVEVDSDSSLNFLLVGDWGWEGSYNASAVAYQVSSVMRACVRVSV